MKSYDISQEINHNFTVINIEEFNLKNTRSVKFAIPTILPGVNIGNVIENTVKTTNSHILNKVDIPNESFEICNYMIASLPYNIAKQCPHDINKVVKKGLQFVATFVDGEPLELRILGRSE